MSFNNPYAQYNNSKILTASPGELTLMLYEGAIKFGNLAKQAMIDKDIEKAHNNIIKVEKIIEEFQITLNRKYPVAEEFDKIYKYIIRRLGEANISKDPEDMEEILGHLRSMRDNWKEVMKKAKEGTA